MTTVPDSAVGIWVWGKPLGRGERMAQIVAIHSFRGGTGKSNTTANMASILANSGQRVAVIDGDIQSPGIHVLFGLDGEQLQHSLNTYLQGDCTVEQAAHDVGGNVGIGDQGALYLIPSSLRPADIARILREGYDVGLLQQGLHRLIDVLKLDVLMIDTHPGLNEETLLSIAIADALLIILRPDQQDYLGTAVTVEVARQLKAPRILLAVNKLPPVYDAAEVRAKVEQSYRCEVAAVIPHSDEMLAFGSGGIFALRYPDHPVTQAYRRLSASVTQPVNP